MTVPAVSTTRSETPLYTAVYGRPTEVSARCRAVGDASEPRCTKELQGRARAAWWWCDDVVMWCSYFFTPRIDISWCTSSSSSPAVASGCAGSARIGPFLSEIFFPLRFSRFGLWILNSREKSWTAIPGIAFYIFFFFKAEKSSIKSNMRDKKIQENQEFLEEKLFG